jgi:hypothetical protein
MGMNKPLFAFALLCGAIGTTMGVTNLMDVYGSGPEWDCDEDYTNIPGACQCWHDGYTDATNNTAIVKFNEVRDDECKDKGNQYSAGFEAASK